MPGIDDYMDELFQKAASDYPLKTSGANWSKVSGKLKPVTKARKKPVFSGYRLLAAASVAGAVVLFGLLWYNQPAPVSEQEELASSFKRDSSADKRAPELAKTDLNKKIEGGMDAAKTPNHDAGKHGNYPAGLKAPAPAQKPVVSLAAATIRHPSQKHSGQEAGPQKKQNNTSESDSVHHEAVVLIAASGRKRGDLAEKENTKEPAPSQTFAGHSPAVYYGFAIGPQLSQVKQQGVTKPGFSAGLVLGVNMKKRVAIETGLHFSQKSYLSGGEYFYPKPGAMPDGMHVLSLDGTSSYLEIPLNIKYNLSGKPNTLYLTSGLSSYLMIRERNNYKAEMNGTQTQMRSSYREMNPYTAADLNIGVGYQHSVGKSSIRVEPFVQIPLRGTGVGSLKVLNTGLQVIINTKGQQRQERKKDNY